MSILKSQHCMKKQQNISKEWDDFDQRLSIFDSDNDDQQEEVKAYAPFIKKKPNKDLDSPEAFKRSGRPNKHYSLSQNTSNHSQYDKDQSEQKSANSIEKLNGQASIDDNDINFSQLHFSMNDLTEQQINYKAKLPPASQVQTISQIDSQQQRWQDEVKKEYQKCQEFVDRRRLKRGSKKIKPAKEVNDEQFCRYRRKRMVQRPKGLTKEQLERLKEDFEQLHNQQSQQEDQPSVLKKRTYQNDKLTIRQLAKKYCTTRPTIHSLYRQWRFDPTLSRALSKFQRQFILTHGGAHTIIARTKTQMRVIMLQQVIQQNPFLTQLELAVALRNKDPDMNRNVQRSVVLRLLRLGNFKKKKIRILSRERNDPIHIELRRKYAQRYRQCIVKDFNVYFYDQMLINECYDKDTGWCRSEEEVKFKPEKLINTSIVVIGILSSTGRLTWNAKFGNYSPEAIQTILDKMLESNENKSTRNVLVLNPLPYRDMTRLIRIARDRDWLTLELPIHGMQLNPLYPYFLQLKDVLKKIKFTTVEKLFEDVEILLREREDSYYGKKYIDCLNMYIIRALAKQKF